MGNFGVASERRWIEILHAYSDTSSAKFLYWHRQRLTQLSTAHHDQPPGTDPFSAVRALQFDTIAFASIHWPNALPQRVYCTCSHCTFFFRERIIQQMLAAQHIEA